MGILYETRKAYRILVGKPCRIFRKSLKHGTITRRQVLGIYAVRSGGYVTGSGSGPGLYLYPNGRVGTYLFIYVFAHPLNNQSSY
jgi:hypothetical protein